MLDNRIIVKVSSCACCNRNMISRRWKRAPDYYLIEGRLSDWMEARRFVYDSDAVDSNDEPICEICKKEGKSSFKCAICDEIKPSSKIKHSFGDPAEYLCVDCYNSVSAAEWDKKVDALEGAHRYDFE